MTDKTDSAALIAGDAERVTQADREAAVPVWSQIYNLGGPPRIRKGDCDEHPIVQAFAAHRLAGERAGMERAAGITGDGFRCRTCDAIFTSDVGHPYPECDYPNWDRLTPEQAAQAIRAQAGEAS